MPADAEELRLQEIALGYLGRPKREKQEPRPPVRASRDVEAPGPGVIAFQQWINHRFGGEGCALRMVEECDGSEQAEAYQHRNGTWRIRYRCMSCERTRVKNVGAEDLGDVEQTWLRLLHGHAMARGLGWKIGLTEWRRLSVSQQFIRMYLAPQLAETLEDLDNDAVLWAMPDEVWTAFSLAHGEERERIWRDWREGKLF